MVICTKKTCEIHEYIQYEIGKRKRAVYISQTYNTNAYKYFFWIAGTVVSTQFMPMCTGVAFLDPV